jgi:hypothetical protein
MRSKLTRLAIVIGLLGAVASGMACDSEPTGSCTRTNTGFVSDDPSTAESHPVCYPDTTATECEQTGGTFNEGDDCFLFDVFHPPS